MASFKLQVISNNSVVMLIVSKRFYPVYLFLFLTYCVGCAQEKKNYIVRIYCDAEKTVEGDFVSQGERFGNSETQSSEKSYSGNHSALLKVGREYGMTYQFNDVEEGDRFVIRVKRYSESGNGTLEAAARKIHLGHFATKDPTKKELENGWEELELDVIIPYGVKKFRVYLRNNTQEPVYFDDLEIERYEKLNPDYGNRPTLQLFLDSLHLAEMVQLRETALKKGDIIDSKTKKEFDVCVDLRQ